MPPEVEAATGPSFAICSGGWVVVLVWWEVEVDVEGLVYGGWGCQWVGK